MQTQICTYIHIHWLKAYSWKYHLLIWIEVALGLGIIVILFFFIFIFSFLYFSQWTGTIFAVKKNGHFTNDPKMWVNQNRPVFSLLKARLWLESSSGSPIRLARSSGASLALPRFQKTVKSAAPAHGLRAQEDWVTGITLSFWGLSQKCPLWTGHPVHLCWSLYRSSGVTAPSDCSPELWAQGMLTHEWVWGQAECSC